MPQEFRTSPRIVFFFSGSREKTVRDARAGQGTDTALRGWNHIGGAEYLAFGDYRSRLPRPLRVVFLIPRLFRYDFVVAQDELFLGYVVSVLAKLFLLKTRWLYVTMTSSTLMRRHATHPIRLSLLKKFWASYTRIVCLSQEQREDLIRFGIPREHLVFVPFGVDAQFFKSAGMSNEENLVVSVGRDSGRDYATLFKAAAHSDYALVVVASPKNIPSDVPIPANVSVLYDRPLVEVRDLYARARLVVIASKDTSQPDGSDCSGQTVILDALAAGKAVIATHRPWITDYFIPDQDIVVVPPNDPEALAQAIDALLHDPERRERIAASGHAKVVARYTTAAFARSLLTLMDSIGKAS